MNRRPRNLRRWAWATLAPALLLGGPAFAQPRDPKRLVFYAEGTAMDVASVRARLREAVPDAVVAVDAVDFRSLMIQKGLKPPAKVHLGSAKERTVLFEQMRSSARDMHADGVVYVLLNNTPKRRVVRLI